MAFYVFSCCVALLVSCAQIGSPPGINTDPLTPPAIPREFRAAWVATVANIDWPSKKNLSVAEQQQEIIRIVDRAKELNLNALIFQVRPAADALYPSALEPWSEYLSGEQGKGPEPAYDPLKMWVEESHRRGIELHAWFNPYRARHISAKSTNAATHIANTNPEAVKDYGGYLWMDPGEPFAVDRTLAVILDVVRRYDIDGVHVDDYFYPYPVNVPGSMPPIEQDFPDEPAWQRFVSTGGSLSRADWRRQNVNQLMERINRDIHREKPWVRFGISPFGVGKPDRRPPGIVGFSQYDKLYADVELWLEKGWLDYLAPQLYWPIEQTPQAFGTLMHYWLAQNPSGRHVWPGMFTSRIDSSAKSWKVEEIINQVGLMRANAAVTGHIHFSMVAIMENRQGISDQLKRAYSSAALPPATPWLGNDQLAAAQLRVKKATQNGNTFSVEMLGATGDTTRQYAIWQRLKGEWKFTVLPVAANSTIAYSQSDALSGFIATPIDRFGNAGVAATLTAADVAAAK